MTRKITDLEGRLGAAMTRADKLTKKEAHALELVKNGADVYDYGIALTLRRLEKRGLVTITKAVNDNPGSSRLPYFGAIAKGSA